VVFYDDGTMQQLFTFDLDRMEQSMSCATCRFEGSSKEYFVVGTAHVIPEEQEPSRGRILVFEVTGGDSGEERRMHLIAEKEEKGAVFTLAPLNGKLVAGIGSKVSVDNTVKLI
jgi:DNA damage-binding protein 1